MVIPTLYDETDQTAIYQLSYQACRAALRACSDLHPSAQEKRFVYGEISRYLSVLETILWTLRWPPHLYAFYARLKQARELTDRMKDPAFVSDDEIFTVYSFCLEAAAKRLA
jgi:hypothetical protein